MSKKHKDKKSPQKEMKPSFIEIHWEKIVLVVLFVIPLVYFSAFLSPERMIGGSDYLIGGYPFEKWTAEQKEMPLWYPHVFGGVPVLGAPVGGPLAPLAQLRAIMPPQVVLALTFIIFFFAAGLGMYLYLKEIGISPYAAAVGAIIYQFIGNLATTPNAGHAGRAASIALFPLMLFFVHRALASKKLIYFILTALVTACAFYEGHFQITYYGLLFILAYAIYYLIAHRREYTARDVVKVVGYGISAVVVICLLMAAIWLPVLGGFGTAARGVERGFEYATSWSMPPREMIDLVIPTYSGLLDNYWGLNQFKIHLEYFGVLAIVLALLAVILYWKKPYVKFYTIGAIIVLLMALGGHTPFFRVFYTLIPGFRLFRAPALGFYLTSFSVIVVAALGFEHIFKQKDEANDTVWFKKRFYAIGGILLAVFVITGLVCALGRNSIVQSMQESLRSAYATAFGSRLAEMKLNNIATNFSNFLEGIWRSCALIAVILFMIYLSVKRQIKIWIFAIAAMAITLIDQLPLMAKYLPSAPAPEVYYAADDVVRSLQKDKSVFRVFPTPWYEHANDLYLLYHDIQSVGGYIPNPIQRYQEFIGAGTSVMFRPTYLLQSPTLVDILNAKYVIAPVLPKDVSRYDMQTQLAIQEIKNYLTRFSPFMHGQRYAVYQNDSTLPRAYVVPDYKVLEESEIMDFIRSQTFDPRQMVILEEDPKVPHAAESMSGEEARITHYSANRIVCTTQYPHPGFLVVADNWYPDWKAFVDGKESTLYRANYTFRAVYVTPGTHEVVFAYISRYFNIGKIISIITLIVSIVFCIIVLKPTRLLRKESFDDSDKK